MSKWLQETLSWMKTLPRHEPQDAAVVGGYEDPPRSKVVFHNVQAPEAVAPAPSQPSTPTPLAEIKAGVQRAREQLEAERQARANRDHVADPPEVRACGVAHDGYCADETADGRMRRVFRDERRINHVKRRLAREVARMAAQVPDPPQPYTEALKRLGKS